MRVRSLVGVALCAVGGLWVGQGIGWIGGSFMSGEAVWAVIGAVAIGFGITLLRRPAQGGRGLRADDQRSAP